MLNGKLIGGLISALIGLFGCTNIGTDDDPINEKLSMVGLPGYGTLSGVGLISSGFFYSSLSSTNNDVVLSNGTFPDGNVSTVPMNGLLIVLF